MGRMLVVKTVALHLATSRPWPIGGLTPAQGMNAMLIRHTQAPDAGVRVPKEDADHMGRRPRKKDVGHGTTTDAPAH